ncbi:hypothetical protein [Spirosoma sp. KUDC1026]|uniref:hypothetical protein n=1 Tax=Spirosoma sp. KUDC1026 TaxID=2745947 RepID=UPI00159BA8CB|nr:hypothetical protein [Spirosoma sp. KUDC1026]QKZ14462.1 hypothetical protein HU175_18250 [Spirosoma sp. KUDC1026]
MPAAFRYLIACLFILPMLAHAQTLDTLTTEQLLDRKGSAYQRERAQLRPSHYLVFDVNHTLGGFRRYRFFEGDDIHFRARGEKYHEEVYQITDSTFSVLIANEVMNRDEPVTFRLDEVEKIIIHRRIPFVTAAGTIFPAAGAVYLLADLVNNGEVSKRAWPVAGAFALSGAIFHWISNPTIRANKNHKLRVLKTY